MEKLKLSTRLLAPRVRPYLILTALALGLTIVNALTVYEVIDLGFVLPFTQLKVFYFLPFFLLPSLLQQHCLDRRLIWILPVLIAYPVELFASDFLGMVDESIYRLVYDGIEYSFQNEMDPSLANVMHWVRQNDQLLRIQEALYHLTPIFYGLVCWLCLRKYAIPTGDPRESNS